MQSNKANAVWASQTSSQTVGVNNWTQYQLSLTGSSYRFQINSAATTSTNLQYYTNREGVNITAGDSILLSTNGSTFTSGTAGAVTFVGPSATQLTAPSSPGTAPALAYYGRVSYISPDGFNLYMVRSASGTGSTGDWVIYQYALSTAFDIQTASYTGKTSFQFAAGTYGSGFTFKPDGTILYLTQDINIYAYALGTAWDISTANSARIGQVSLNVPAPGGNWSSAVNFTHIAFSPDGTKVILQNVRTDNNQTTSPSSYGNFAIYTLSVPWVINTCATTTTNFTNTSSFWYYTTSSYLGFWMSPDGRTITIWSAESGSTANAFMTFTMATPYVLPSSPAISIRTSNIGPGMTAQEGAAYFSASGTIFYINWKSGVRASSTGNDLYGKYNVNISSFSLGAAPTFAYNAAPTVRVDAETTAARVNLFPYEVYQASSTTSQAVIYKPTSGYVAANDTILLNGTTSVTVTSVTEGTNLGVAAVPITTAANRTYANKVIGLPYSGTNYNYNFRISPDGATMIAGLKNGTYGTGLYQFTLTTPFDINTAVFANRYVSVTGDGNSISGNTAGATVAFDVVPDGSRLILSGFITGSSTSQTNMTVREYTMSQFWDIGTLVPTGVTWSSGVGATNSGTINCLRFVPNGSQLVIVRDMSPGGDSNTYTNYVSCATPYRIATAPAGPGTNWVTTGTGGGAVHSVTFSPDGLNIITHGNITTSNTLGTANNMATATQTNAPNSTTTKWAWPSGTMSPTSAAAWGGHFSPDGTKFYVTNADGGTSGYQNIWQMNVIVIPQTSYNCNFATQGSAPTSVVIPDRSVAQTITTTLSGGNMTFAASAVATNARGIATKITAPGNFTTVTNATLSMWRS